jgi:hypothetical protein
MKLPFRTKMFLIALFRIHKYNEGKLSIIILSDAPPHILCHILKSKRSQMLPGGDTCFFIPSTLLIVIFKQLSKLLFVQK